MQTYLLSLVTSSLNEVSHTYILMTLIPDRTSFIKFILWSVHDAIIDLRNKNNISKKDCEWNEYQNINCPSP